MEHHRFFVDATSPDGQVLRLFTDTGGGMNLTTRGADKLGLAYDQDNNLGSEHEPVFGTTPWPAYAGPWIPPPKSAAVQMDTGRATCRERVCPQVYYSGGTVRLNKNNKIQT